MEEKLVPVDIKTTMLDPNADYKLKAHLIPSFRNIVANQKGIDKKILLKSWGGLGDMITAEPTIRYAVENFKGYEISLEAMIPELFSHLTFHEVYDHFNDPKIDESQYYVFNTICSDVHFPWEFMCGLYNHCIDFSSLIAFRCQLPKKYKEIVLKPCDDHYAKIFDIIKYEIKTDEFIVIHPGKHWQSKTFPKWWWDRVIEKINKSRIVPVIIGGHKDDENGLRTTVNVETSSCVDLRCKLEPMETVALLKKSKVLLTNDSAPLHMAASTDAWIGFIATCKHPEFITHYRHGIFGWRMENLGLGGVWDYTHALSEISVIDVGNENLLKWLPNPESFAEWGINKINSK